MQVPGLIARLNGWDDFDLTGLQKGDGKGSEIREEKKQKDLCGRHSLIHFKIYPRCTGRLTDIQW